MLSHWTFGKRLAAGFGFAGLVLLVVGIAGFYSTYRLIENNRRVNHSHQGTATWRNCWPSSLMRKPASAVLSSPARIVFLTPYNTRWSDFGRPLTAFGHSRRIIPNSSGDWIKSFR